MNAALIGRSAEPTRNNDAFAPAASLNPAALASVRHVLAGAPRPLPPSRDLRRRAGVSRRQYALAWHRLMQEVTQ